MIKYRIKTKEEFGILRMKTKEGVEYPSGWNSKGEMNCYYGVSVPSRCNDEIEDGCGISWNRWQFYNEDFIEIVQNYEIY